MDLPEEKDGNCLECGKPIYSDKDYCSKECLINSDK